MNTMQFGMVFCFSMLLMFVALGILFCFSPKYFSIVSSGLVVVFTVLVLISDFL